MKIRFRKNQYSKSFVAPCRSPILSKRSSRRRRPIGHKIESSRPRLFWFALVANPKPPPRGAEKRRGRERSDRHGATNKCPILGHLPYFQIVIARSYLIGTTVSTRTFGQTGNPACSLGSASEPQKRPMIAIALDK